MNNVIEELEASIAFEKQRNINTKENQMNGWNTEYHTGYIDGLKQALAIMKLSK